MKSSIVFSMVLVAIMSAALSFSQTAFGDDNSDLLNKALDLVQQAWNPGGDPPSNDQRTDLLTQALKLVKEAPNHHVGGHRVQAMLDIKAALAEIQKGDPDNKAVEFIHDAHSELRTALSIAQ